jgi:hypothetical protein
MVYAWIKPSLDQTKRFNMNSNLNGLCCAALPGSGWSACGHIMAASNPNTDVQRISSSHAQLSFGTALVDAGLRSVRCLHLHDRTSTTLPMDMKSTASC